MTYDADGRDELAANPGAFASGTTYVSSEVNEVP